jgi:DegV family protein with EDD domain
MSRIAIVTDSVACVPESLRQELGIHQLPFGLIWDGVQYRDGETITPSEFYTRFRKTNHTFPTTSQPSLGVLVDCYQSLVEKCDGIVSIHVAANLTGTVNTARLAAAQVDRVPIRILDSRTATIAQGFVVLAAARVAAQGGTIDQVVDAAERVIAKVDFFATLKTLEHVHRGGRLGEAATLLGSQLHIVPIMNLKNGAVSIVGLTRSWKHALEQIVDLSVEHVNHKTAHVSVFHADALRDAEWLRDQFTARVQCVEFYITEFTPVMGAHTGPDVVGIAFYVDD